MHARRLRPRPRPGAEVIPDCMSFAATVLRLTIDGLILILAKRGQRLLYSFGKLYPGTLFLIARSYQSSVIDA